MKKIELIKKIRDETGLSLGVVKNVVQTGKNYEDLKQELLMLKENDIARVSSTLEIDIEIAEKLYIEYNCSVDRCILEETKKNKPINVSEKKNSIGSRLSKGELLVGEIPGRESDGYHWITVKKGQMII